MNKAKKALIALAGNPNCGKTSLFNALTGANQHVGNYPGVTVERRSGSFKDNGVQFEALDLPGTYSLTSYSPEERVAQDELLRDDLDVVIIVVDSLALKRSLVLMTQVLQTGANPILCLNMADEARRAGQKIDVPLLESLLGFPVIETVGYKGEGTQELKKAINHVLENPIDKNRVVLGDRLTPALSDVKEKLDSTSLSKRHNEWFATKLLMADAHFTDMVQKEGEQGKRAIDGADVWRRKLEKDTATDVNLYVMQCYYGFVDGLLKEVITQHPKGDARALSDQVDKVVVNRLLGIPIFLGVMYTIFWVTFTVGDYPMGWIETGFELLGEWIDGFWAKGEDSPVRSLIVDGIIGGVGGVVVFLPNILLLFLGLALLEDTGYMSRAAFLVDKFMHRFGLHGKSFIPLMTGFGCSIPGIMATRTMENEKDRLATMLVLPLMSCGARLPIWMLLIPAFFVEELRAPALFGIYIIGVILALLLALTLKKTILKGEDAPLAMELPPYRMPTLRAVIMRMLERSMLYLKKAGTIILAISLILWVLTSYPKWEADTEEIQVAQKGEIDEETLQNVTSQKALENSFAGKIGRAIEPVIEPLGFDWKIGVALIGALAAKEVFVSQLGIIYSMGEADEESESLRSAIQNDYSPIVGFALMLFLLISAPCMATIAVTKRESGSWKWAMLQLGGLTALGYIVALLVYQIGSLIT